MFRVIKLFSVLFLLFLSGTISAFAQDVVVTVNATDGKKAVSPYIYGRNGSFYN